MSDKAIIVTDMPESCDKCKLKSTVRGIQGITHACNLAEDMISLDKMFVERLDNCPLTSLREHDKGIRSKVIEEFAEKLNNKISEFVLRYKDNLDFASGIAVAWNIVDEIAEQMKEVGE